MLRTLTRSFPEGEEKTAPGTDFAGHELAILTSLSRGLRTAAGNRSAD